jgi:DNA-binding LacI/PurR family transcriptional regulator
MITSKEFARIIGVSQSTVSRALNNSPLVPPDKKALIKEMAAQYGFVLNSQARSLKTSKTGTIGIIFPRFFSSFSKNLMLTYIYDQIQRELIRNNYDIMAVYDYIETSEMPVFERIIKSQKIDGLINLRPNLSDEEMALVVNYHVPCVAIFDARQNNKALHQFIVDDKYAGFIAGQYIGKQAGYYPVYMSPSLKQEEPKLRLKGFSKGLSLYDRKIKDNAILQCGLSMREAYDIVIKNKKWFCSNKTAILAYNDLIAIGVMNALKDLGIAIPEQTQLIGMDDIPMAIWVDPLLSTIRFPVEEMVVEACGLLCRLIKKEKVAPIKKLLKSELILRGTTKNNALD